MSERPVDLPDVPGVLQVGDEEHPGPFATHHALHVSVRRNPSAVPTEPPELSLRGPVATMQPTDPSPPVHPHHHVGREEFLPVPAMLLGHPLELSVELADQRRPALLPGLLLDLPQEPVETTATTPGLAETLAKDWREAAR